MIQKEEVNGPSRYLTTDWKLAYESVVKLEALKAELLIPGHGKFMLGKELAKGMDLVREFDTKAIPSHGKFVREDDRSVVSHKDLKP